MKAIKKFKKLQGIGATRLRLGLTQELFALELGLSRSLLCKVENRERTLPLAALEKLAEIEKRLGSNGDVHGEARGIKTTQNTLTPGDHHRMAGCERDELQLLRLQTNLERMQQSHEVLGASMACMEKLLQGEPGCAPNPGSIYLQVQWFTLQGKQKKCGPLAQSAVQHRIHILQATIALRQARRPPPQHHIKTY